MATKEKKVEAVAYIRTSSAANVGSDKDSDKRQRAAIEGYAERAGLPWLESSPTPPFPVPTRLRRAMASLICSTALRAMVFAPSLLRMPPALPAS